MNKKGKKISQKFVVNHTPLIFFCAIYIDKIFVGVDGTKKMVKGVWLTTIFQLFNRLRFIYINLLQNKLLTMFIEGNCAIYIDKNLKVSENSTGISVLW